MTIKPSALVNRNVLSAKRRTSVRLEPEFWTALQEEADRRRVPVRELTRTISAEMPRQALTSAIRVWLLRAASKRATANETV